MMRIHSGDLALKEAYHRTAARPAVEPGRERCRCRTISGFEEPEPPTRCQKRAGKGRDK